MLKQHQRRVGEARQAPTAHLAQTMAFLHCTTAELEEQLRKELDANPALELVDELRCPECGRKLNALPCPVCAAPRGESSEPIVYLAPREIRRARTDDDDARAEMFEARTPERLDEYILQQIAAALTTADERRVAAYLLARLNEDGLFPESIAEAAQFNRVSLDLVGRVLNLIQHADPPGVGARTPDEALLIQLESLCETAPSDLCDLARRIIRDHFEQLARRDVAALARALRVTRAEVEAALVFIQRNLTPYPALANWGENKLPPVNPAAYRQPDINISFVNHAAAGPLMVEVFTPLSGYLRVDPEIKAALPACGEADRENWTRAVDRAALVTKCLQQRNHTMRRLMQVIAAEQRSFILGGDSELRPMTRARLAGMLELHESTISRAVAGKSVALPDGRMIPLAKFFDRSLSVRDRVRAIIEAEPRPLTDDEIAARLAEGGIVVARRTVAKYRNMLGILPANWRARQARTLAASPPS